MLELLIDIITEEPDEQNNNYAFWGIDCGDRDWMDWDYVAITWSTDLLSVEFYTHVHHGDSVYVKGRAIYNDSALRVIGKMYNEWDGIEASKKVRAYIKQQEAR